MKAAKTMQFGENKQQVTVEQARAAMLAAGEAPGSAKTKAANESRRAAYQQALQTGYSPEQALQVSKAAYDLIINGGVRAPEAAAPQQRQQAPTAQPQRAQVPAQQQQAPAQQQVTQQTQQPKREVIENRKYSAEIKQADGVWVAEVTYKTGGGRERFTAATKNGLLLALLEGKANATLKVREVVRNAKLGSDYEQTYNFPDISQEEFDAIPASARAQLIDAQAAKASVAFKENFPEFWPTDLNSERLLGLLEKKKAVISYNNLVKAFEELSNDDLLEFRPEDDTLAPEVFTTVEDSAVEQVPPAAVIAPRQAPEPQVRKRGTTGLMPDFSSAGPNTSLETVEEGRESREPSHAELRAMSDKDLRAAATASRLANRRQSY